MTDFLMLKVDSESFDILLQITSSFQLKFYGAPNPSLPTTLTTLNNDISTGKTFQIKESKDLYMAFHIFNLFFHFSPGWVPWLSQLSWFPSRLDSPVPRLNLGGSMPLCAVMWRIKGRIWTKENTQHEGMGGWFFLPARCWKKTWHKLDCFGKIEGMPNDDHLSHDDWCF